MIMLNQEIKDKAARLGFISCGIIPAGVFTEYEKYLDERVRAFPKSRELYARMYEAVKPYDSAESIIVCVQRLNKYKLPPELNGRFGKNYLFDGRLSYAYESRAGAEFETFLKIHGMNILQCQIPARWAAARAGLGKFGWNNFIFDPDHGSYISIKLWVVDKALEYDPISSDIQLSHCGEDCLKCVEACPTKAMTGRFSMDMGKCAAHLTFSGKDIPDETTRAQMGEWIYGCDICQDVCHMNQNKFTETEEFPLLDEFIDILKPESLLEMDEETYKNAVCPRFWYSGEEGLWQWKCNALRVMINSGKPEYHEWIKKYQDDKDERVRETARWGRGKLGI